MNNEQIRNIMGRGSHELLPCPHCGSADLEHGPETALSFSVRCYGCGARGPAKRVPDYWGDDKEKTWVEDLMEKTAAAWNRRVE